MHVQWRDGGKCQHPAAWCDMQAPCFGVPYDRMQGVARGGSAGVRFAGLQSQMTGSEGEAGHGKQERVLKGMLS